MFLYHSVRQKMFKPELGSYITFGLLALQLLSGRCHRVCLVPDVSTSEAFVRSLAAQCTAAQLDPRQLEDVIDDALAF